jgi:hypothetical protein
MSSKTSTATLADAADAFGQLFSLGAKVGLGLLSSFKVPTRVGGCSCEIPPPCWAPLPLGDVQSRVCPGDKAVLRLNVTNCGTTARTFDLDAPGASIDPQEVTLGPMEEGVVVVSAEVPAGEQQGESRNVLVWVRGCREHYLHWTIKVGRRWECRAAEVDVEDCPDLVHHWYDHFYCQRPCPHRQ